MEEKSSANRVVLDKNTPLSLSKLWNYQRDFYLKNSINAWVDKVPFYITSNPYIANSYAHIIIRFFQDIIKNNSLPPTGPFYIVELGAGSGTFSFHLLNSIYYISCNSSIQFTTSKKTY